MNKAIMAAAAVAALGMAGTSANAMTFIASGSAGDGPESAQAVITTSGNQLTVDLTSLINSANGGSKLAAGEEVSGIEIFFDSAPGTKSGFSQSGQLINIAGGGGVTDVSGDPDHWGAKVDNNNLFIATAGEGSQSGKPINLIIGDASSYPTVNSSITGRNPQIQGTGTFVVDFATALTAAITKVRFEFGTSPDSYLNGVCTAGCGNAVPEPATWAMMLVGFFGLGAMLRRRRARLARTVA